MLRSRRSFRLTLILAAGFLIATVMAGAVAQRQRFETAWWVDHTNQVKLVIDDARLKLLQSELEPVGGRRREQAFRELAADAVRLRALTRDNQRQQARIEHLESELAVAEATGARRAVAAGDGEPARGGDEAREASAADTVGATLVELGAEEDALMTVRQRAMDAARTASAVVLAFSAVVTSLLVVAAFVTLSRLHGASARQSVLLEAILDNIGDGVLAADRQGRVLVANAAARRMFGQAAVDRIAAPDAAGPIRAVLPNGEPLAPRDCALARALRGEAAESTTYRLDREGAEAIWVNASGNPLRAPHGQLFGAVAVYHDVSEQKRHAEALKSLSLTDELTGLHNRRGFLVLAEQHARMAARNKAPYALLFGDMNGLKKINDTLGHEAGDDAIREMARVLKTTLRETDIVARLGGDEFVALLVTEPSAVETIGRRIRDALERENDRGPRRYRLSLSTGMALFDPAAPRSVHDLLAEADHRMYEHKAERHRMSAPVLRSVGGS